jgi:hypothetical protein
MINLVVFACREGEDVVLGEHLGQTAVVCDHSCCDATETPDLDNVDFLVQEACIVNVEWIILTKVPSAGIRTNTQNKERRREQEEQDRQANRFAERANAMKKRGHIVRGGSMFTFDALFERERTQKNE